MSDYVRRRRTDRLQALLRTRVAVQFISTLVFVYLVQSDWSLYSGPTITQSFYR